MHINLDILQFDFRININKNYHAVETVYKIFFFKTCFIFIYEYRLFIINNQTLLNLEKPTEQFFLLKWKLFKNKIDSKYMS